MTFAQLKSLLDDLPVKWSDTERGLFINEAYKDLATRSGYARKRASITVTDGEEPLPTDCYEIKAVTLGGLPLARADQAQVELLGAGELSLRTSGVYYVHPSDDGSDPLQIIVHPTPTAGDILEVRYIFAPADLTGNDGVPNAIPISFHRALVTYCYWQAHEMNGSPEARVSFYRDQYEAKVAELRAHRNTEGGRGPVQMRVKGIHIA